MSEAQTFDTAPLRLGRLLVALDASDHANHALGEASRLAKAADGEIVGIHAYAAKLHDRRFRQMEGGLPERYRKEEEMEHQRVVHDDLITRGLGTISDSYHDTALEACQAVATAIQGKRLVEARLQHRRRHAVPTARRPKQRWHRRRATRRGRSHTRPARRL